LLTVTEIEVLSAVLPALSVVFATREWEPFDKEAVSRLNVQLLVPIAIAKLAPSTDSWTKEIDRLLEAVPDTVTIPDTVDPFAGDVIVTTGGATVLFTVTRSLALVVLFPDVSVATAFNVWAPFELFVVSQL
jgi:hypothetical protein